MLSAWRRVAAAKPARPAPTTMTPVGWEGEGLGLGGVEIWERVALGGVKDLKVLKMGEEEESGRESAASDILDWIRISSSNIFHSLFHFYFMFVFSLLCIYICQCDAMFLKSNRISNRPNNWITESLVRSIQSF